MNKQTLTILLVSILCVFASCKKKSAESELPDATNTGMRTIGFLANGQSRYTSGEPNSVWSAGVEYGHFADSTIDIVSSAGSPRFTFIVRFRFADKVGSYPLSSAYPCRAYYFEPTNGSTIPTDDTEFKNDGLHTGQVKITYWDGNIIAGTFDMDLVNKSGGIVHITNGRFDIPF